MAGGITADRLADLELAYAPPFSSAKDPVNLLGYMAENVLSGDCDVVDPRELDGLVARGMDPRRRAHGRGARRRRDPRIDQRADRLAPRAARRARHRTRRRLLRGRPARTHRDRADARARYQGRNLDGGYRTWTAWTAARMALAGERDPWTPRRSSFRSTARSTPSTPFPIAEALAARVGGGLVLVSAQFHGPLDPHEYLGEQAARRHAVPVRHRSHRSTSAPRSRSRLRLERGDDRIVCMTTHGRGSCAGPRSAASPRK